MSMMRLLDALALLFPLAFAQYGLPQDDIPTVVEAVSDKLTVLAPTTPAPVLEFIFWEDLQRHAEEYYNNSKGFLMKAEQELGFMAVIGLAVAVAVSILFICMAVCCCCSLCCSRRKKAKTGSYQFPRDEMA